MREEIRLKFAGASAAINRVAYVTFAVEYRALCALHSRMSAEVSIIIPNWNGTAFLERCVGAVLQSAVESDFQFECILIDDASTDGSAEAAAAKFPQVRLIKQQVNQGFGRTVNNAAHAADGEYLLLLNNDLIAKPGFVEQLCMPMSDPQVFGVSGRTISWGSNEPNHVSMMGELVAGRLQLTWSDPAEASPTMFLQGGSCTMRKKLFLDFGGFHPLFYPGYWEDYDLSYLAIKSGYKNIYEPKASGAHLGQGSMIRAYGEERIQYVRERNRWLMLALNLSGEAYDEFWRKLPRHLCLESHPRFKVRMKILHFLWQNRSEIALERARRAEFWKVSDDEVFRTFAGKGLPSS